MIFALLLSVNACTPSPIYRTHPRTGTTSGNKPRKLPPAEKTAGCSLKPPIRNFDRSRIISGFGLRKHPAYQTSEFHPGIDIDARTGEQVMASGTGLIIYAGKQSGYGNIVIIEHDNDICTVYAHLSAILAENGSAVKEGQIIGRVGLSGNSTGPHLHFEVRIGGEAVDPVDYLPGE